MEPACFSSVVCPAWMALSASGLLPLLDRLATESLRGNRQLVRTRHWILAWATAYYAWSTIKFPVKAWTWASHLGTSAFLGRFRVSLLQARTAPESMAFSCEMVWRFLVSFQSDRSLQTAFSKVLSSCQGTYLTGLVGTAADVLCRIIQSVLCTWSTSLLHRGTGTSTESQARFLNRTQK